MRCITFFSLTWLIFYPVGVFASELTGSVVHNYIVSNFDKKGEHSNPAIGLKRKFPKCNGDLQMESIFGSWKTVKVSCTSNDWSIVVRTNINSDQPVSNTLKSTKNDNQEFVVVLKTSLNKGDLIDGRHLEYSPKKNNLGGGVFYEKEFLNGRRLKTALSVGTIIRARHLTPDWVIEKDQVVTIEHKVGNIVINAQGIAQQSGQLGEKIWVNNFNSGKKVLCWVKNNKKVSTSPKIY